MNALLLNRDGFQMPADGWYQVAPLGEFGHAQAGLTQVVDAEACQAMVNGFAEEARTENFAGLLVDFDHFSLDGEKRSEAAGWITALEARCNRAGGKATDNADGRGLGDGVFAKIRWSDVGEEAVKGGRYRFLSPVWSRADCVDLGNGRVRPVRLLNAAVTNDPNLKGMRPLSNSATAAGEPRFKWVLGDTPEGRHCPSCTAVAGQVHTMAEWDASGMKPGAAVLCCRGNCKCRLEPTGDAAGGVLKDVPVRKEDAVKNSQTGGRSDGPGDGSRGERGGRGDGDVLANVGWTNEARAASLAVRRAKASARGAVGGTGGKKAGGSVADMLAKGYLHMTPDEVRQVAKALQEKAKTAAPFTPEELTFLQDSIDDPNAIPATGIGGADGTGSTAKKGTKTKKRDPELGPTDYQTWFEEDGLAKMPQKAVNAYADQLREKMASGDELLTDVEEKFLGEITDKGYEGLNQDDPIFQWQMDRAKTEQRIRQATGMGGKDASARVAEIETRMDGLQPVTPEEEALVEAYHKVKSMPNRQARRDDDAPYIAALVNTGWTDQARVVALAVRRAKTGARGLQGQVVQPGKATPSADQGIYTGGSRYFDESSGQYRNPGTGRATPGVSVPPGWVGQPVYPVKPGQPTPPPYKAGPAVPPGWGGKPVYPVRPGQPMPPPYVPPARGLPPVPPKRPVPPFRPGPRKKGTPVPITPPYRFLVSRTRRFGGGSRSV